MQNAEREWTSLLTALNDASGWSEDEPLHGCAPWTFGASGQVGLPLSLLSEATGASMEALGELCLTHGFDLFEGLPCGELVAVWELPPGKTFPAVAMHHLPLLVLYAGEAKPAATTKQETRKTLRDLALKVIVAWGRTEQGTRVIVPFTGC